MKEGAIRSHGRLKAYADAYMEYEELRGWIIENGGEMLKSLRIMYGHGLRETAKELRVSPSFLSKVERGNEVMSAALASKVLDWLRDQK